MESAEKHYYSISEVSEVTEVKPHVLRYWESQFSMLRPRKSRGGVRMYRRKDVELIGDIKHLLYDRGFTIAGARRKLIEDRRVPRDEETTPGAAGFEVAPAMREVVADAAPVRAALAEIKQEMVRLRDQLQRSFNGGPEKVLK